MGGVFGGGSAKAVASQPMADAAEAERKAAAQTWATYNATETWENAVNIGLGSIDQPGDYEMIARNASSTDIYSLVSQIATSALLSTQSVTAPKAACPLHLPSASCGHSTATQSAMQKALPPGRKSTTSQKRPAGWSTQYFLPVRLPSMPKVSSKFKRLTLKEN